jgi:glucokinase
MILAGDIGGTNTRLALFDMRGGSLKLKARTDFTNAGRGSLVEIIREFLSQHPRNIETACLGIAGPVADGRVELTNLHWKLDEKTLQRDLNIRRVALINDLVAHGEGINELGPSDVLTLRRGTPVPRGNRAIIAPGTGLGEAGLVYDDRTNDYRAIPSEGGHCDFSPTDDRQVALLQFMHKRIGRCSWEDVLCGPGLKNIWTFLTSRGKYHVSGSLGIANPRPADITAAAVAGKCRACVAAVELFVMFYGAEAGNLALKMLATNGVWIGGGIAGHIIKFLKRPALRKAFESKGPTGIHRLLRAIPLHVITSKEGALLGAGHYATHL